MGRITLPVPGPVPVSAIENTSAPDELITAAPPSLSEFRLFAPSSSFFTVGGSGLVYGDAGPQDVLILDLPGTITLDPSFNRGFDTIRLPGIASQWQLARSGSNVLFTDGDTRVVVPVGMTGTGVGPDGAIGVLRYDANSGEVRFGDQIVGTALQTLIEPSQGYMGNDASSGDPIHLFLAQGGTAAAGARSGTILVYGTPESEHVIAQHAGLVFDPSFNRGGDVITLPASVDAYSAMRSGSSILLVHDGGGTLTIPFGTAGLELDFPEGSRTLHYDSTLDAVLIGNQVIQFESTALMTFA